MRLCVCFSFFPFFIQLADDFLHLLLAQGIADDEEHRDECRRSGKPAQEHLDALNGLGALLGVRLEAEVGEEPARHRCAYRPTELLAHRRGTEDESRGTVSATQFGVVGTVGVHRPQEREDAAGADADKALEDEYPHEVVLVEPVKDDAERRCQEHRRGESILLADAVADGSRQHYAEDVRRLAYGEEQPAQHERHPEERNDVVVRLHDVVFKVVHRRSVTNRIEHQRSDSRAEQNPPRAVVEQVSHVVLQRSLRLVDRLHPLFGPREAAQEKHDAHHGDDDDRHQPHVDARIDHHHQRVGDVGVDQLARLAEGRGIERKHADEPERNGEEEQVGAELSPAARRAVGDDADDGVEHRVPHAGDEEHRPHHCRRKPEHIGIENHQVGAEQLPEHRGSHVAQPVTDFFFEFDHGSFCCFVENGMFVYCHAGLQITDERKICQERLRIVEPLQGSIAKARPRRGDGIPACESSLHVAGRNPGLGKLRPRRGDGIPAWESLPTLWGRNPGLGKLAHAVGTESRLGKACPRRGDGIPAWESFATLWGRNPSLRKLRHAVGKELQALFL